MNESAFDLEICARDTALHSSTFPCFSMFDIVSLPRSSQVFNTKLVLARGETPPAGLEVVVDVDPPLAVPSWTPACSIPLTGRAGGLITNQSFPSPEFPGTESPTFLSRSMELGSAFFCTATTMSAGRASTSSTSARWTGLRCPLTGLPGASSTART